MILSRPETGKAFERHIAELDAEVAALNELGSKVAHHGFARNAPRVLKLAAERARFRDHVSRLYREWQQEAPAEVNAALQAFVESLD